MIRAFSVSLVAFCLVGCASFFADRVRDHDATIDAIEVELVDLKAERRRLESGPLPADVGRLEAVRERISEAGDELRGEAIARDAALDHVADEARYRHELLASLLLIGGNALSFVVSKARP